MPTLADWVAEGQAVIDAAAYQEAAASGFALSLGYSSLYSFLQDPNADAIANAHVGDPRADVFAWEWPARQAGQGGYWGRLDVAAWKAVVTPSQTYTGYVTQQQQLWAQVRQSLQPINDLLPDMVKIAGAAWWENWGIPGDVLFHSETNGFGTTSGMLPAKDVLGVWVIMGGNGYPPEPALQTDPIAYRDAVRARFLPIYQAMVAWLDNPTPPPPSAPPVNLINTGLWWLDSATQLAIGSLFVGLVAGASAAAGHYGAILVGRLADNVTKAAGPNSAPPGWSYDIEKDPFWTNTAIPTAELGGTIATGIFLGPAAGAVAGSAGPTVDALLGIPAPTTQYGQTLNALAPIAGGLAGSLASSASSSSTPSSSSTQGAPVATVAEWSGGISQVVTALGATWAAIQPQPSPPSAAPATAQLPLNTAAVASPTMGDWLQENWAMLLLALLLLVLAYFLLKR